MHLLVFAWVPVALVFVVWGGFVGYTNLAFRCGTLCLGLGYAVTCWWFVELLLIFCAYFVIDGFD